MLITVLGGNVLVVLSRFCVMRSCYKTQNRGKVKDFSLIFYKIMNIFRIILFFL